MTRDDLFSFANGNRAQSFVWYDYELINSEVVILWAGTMQNLVKNERFPFNGTNSENVPESHIKKALDEYLKQNGVRPCTLQMIYANE